MGVAVSFEFIYAGVVAKPGGLGDHTLFLKCGQDAVYGRNSVVPLSKVLFYVIVYLNRAKGL